MCATEISMLLVLVSIRCAFSNIIKEQVTQGNYDTLVNIPNESLHPDYQLLDIPSKITRTPRTRSVVNADELHNLASANPLLAALLLSYNLHIWPKSPGFNHPQHLPTNPYVALLLSHYGRYVPVSSSALPPSNSEQSSSGIRGIYGYTAANNYHNNLPFGSYKIYADNRDFR